ncbi:hypothetical protein [Salipiger aestuarii]|uniref:hypothetical protein n=1 Tax=Salipiger aestuarii TaxID=568098 RepID=UPI001680E48E|nr:hypothetical protein [Salipiger aestuarii]
MHPNTPMERALARMHRRRQLWFSARSACGDRTFFENLHIIGRVIEGQLLEEFGS